MYWGRCTKLLCYIFSGCMPPICRLHNPTYQSMSFLQWQFAEKQQTVCRVTYYLASGPLPFLKVELRCRMCKVNYGIVKHGNSDDGYQYYNSHLGVVEASDAVYIDRLVMAMYTSLR